MSKTISGVSRGVLKGIFPGRSKTVSPFPALRRTLKFNTPLPFVIDAKIKNRGIMYG